MKDVIPFNEIKGVVEFYKTRDGETTLELRHNLVTTNARRILRDLVLGKRSVVNEQGEVTEVTEDPAPTIKYLVLGDMNLTQEQATAGVPEETTESKKLIHPTVWVPVDDPENYPNNSATPELVNLTNCITYRFVIGKDQGNVSSGFYCELGLAINNTNDPDSYLFTLINRRPLVKTPEDEISVVYRLFF